MDNLKDIPLDKYDANYAVQPFGLRNMGATCYFNALLQSLISCTSFNKVMLENNFKNPLAKLCSEFLKAVKNNNPNVGEYSPNIWNVMFNLIKSRNDLVKFGYGQQDSHEGYLLFLEALGCLEPYKELSQVQILFEHRYNRYTYCGVCRKFVSKVAEENVEISVQSNLKHPDGDNKSKVDLNELVAAQKNIVNDYKCEKCQSTKKKIRVERITMVPEILVIISKKYTADGKRKENIFTDFPEVLKFGNNEYRAVAQIEHSGGMGGGHYWAVCKRKDGWYNLNDSSYKPDKFSPTNNTYVVFYHVV